MFAAVMFFEEIFGFCPYKIQSSGNNCFKNISTEKKSDDNLLPGRYKG